MHAPSRRHRLLTLSLALMAGGIFFVLFTRAIVTEVAQSKPRECASSPLFQSDTKELFHYAMDSLLEERMGIYTKPTTFRCDRETMAEVIPLGSEAHRIAAAIRRDHPRARIPSSPVYSDFSSILFELYRVYDCHLFTIQHNPRRREVIAEDEAARTKSGVVFDQIDIVGFERDRARRTFERVMSSIRASEEYLPIHASLACARRMGSDVSMAFEHLAEASQCTEPSLVEPLTSLRSL